MRYHILATDYDGTLADQGRVGEDVLNKLKEFQVTGRRKVLVTGREMKDLIQVFPEYKIFDHIVAENGAVIHETATGKEQLLGPEPDPAFIKSLEEKGVYPISVGRVIIATWEPHEQAVLEAIKASGSERQVIFNKGAVMILPPGVNKATGLQSLLHHLHLSLHNTVGVGDAENDGALLQASECAVAVNNALPGLKGLADLVTANGHGKGVMELMDRIIATDLEEMDEKMQRHYPELGVLEDGAPFSISPYRSGILVAGASGSGKTTFTVSITESLVQRGYQFCLIDPEGDYLQLPEAVVVGDEHVMPPLEQIRDLLKDPGQNLVICALAIPLDERPQFFSKFLTMFHELRKEYGHPHWLLLDEAHHLMPAPAAIVSNGLPDDLNNFIIISTSPHALHPSTLSRVGMVITLGKDAAYPFELFCNALKMPVPNGVPILGENEIAVWERDNKRPPFKAKFKLPSQLLQRHKKKYAQGDMSYNSFVFTGPENKQHLVANNLMMFVHLAEGIDADTWMFHLGRQDFSRWFEHTVHDPELAEAGREAERTNDVAASKKRIIDYINQKYTAAG
ncbi:MAG TPA: HAD-IIB family hydrolase [Puia sp.]|nr:HAD-IIB family hydrolase [Puia sp.]